MLYISFKFHQNEIAKNICVLKAVKDNTCKGHCYLRKQLQKQADLEKDFQSVLKEKVEIIGVFLQQLIAIPKTFVWVFSNSINFYSTLQNWGLIKAIFHPPIF